VSQSSYDPTPAEAKRGFIASIISVVFMGSLAFGTAPVPLALAIGLPIAVLLGPATWALIEWGTRGHKAASSSTGAVGGGVGAVLLYTLLPHDATIMFAICLFAVALCTGTAIYLARRMSPA